MAVQKSDQMTALGTDPVTKLATDLAGGKTRRYPWTFTTPAGGVPIADTVQLCRIPAGARLFGGEFASEDMTTGAGAASVQLGDGTTATKYLGTTSIDTAVRVAFGNTIALNFMEKLTTDLVLTATAVTEAWAAAKKFYGYVIVALPND